MLATKTRLQPPGRMTPEPIAAVQHQVVATQRGSSVLQSSGALRRSGSGTTYSSSGRTRRPSRSKGKTSQDAMAPGHRRPSSLAAACTRAMSPRNSRKVSP